MKFSIKDFFQETAELVTFTEKILNGNFIFCAVVLLSFRLIFFQFQPMVLLIKVRLVKKRVFIQLMLNSEQKSKVIQIFFSYFHVLISLWNAIYISYPLKCRFKRSKTLLVLLHALSCLGVCLLYQGKYFGK